MLYRMFSSVPGLYPLSGNCLPKLVSTRNVSRYCQMSPPLWWHGARSSPVENPCPKACSASCAVCKSGTSQLGWYIKPLSRVINCGAPCGEAGLDVATWYRSEPGTSDASLVPGSLLCGNNDPQMGGFCRSLCPLQPEVSGQVEEEVLRPNLRGPYDSESGGEAIMTCAS